jgi:hypothetical protein
VRLGGSALHFWRLLNRIETYGYINDDTCDCDSCIKVVRLSLWTIVASLSNYASPSRHIITVIERANVIRLTVPVVFWKQAASNV